MEEGGEAVFGRYPLNEVHEELVVINGDVDVFKGGAHSYWRGGDFVVAGF
jgi:hypothetical protein